MSTSPATLNTSNSNSRKRKVEFSSLDPKDALEHKRAISRRSSQRHRQRERVAIEECQKKKQTLENANRKLQAENDSFKGIIAMLKQRQNLNHQRTAATAAAQALTLQQQAFMLGSAAAPVAHQVSPHTNAQLGMAQLEWLQHQHEQKQRQQQLAFVGNMNPAGSAHGGAGPASLSQFSNEELMEALIRKQLQQNQHQQQPMAVPSSSNMTSAPPAPASPTLASYGFPTTTGANLQQLHTRNVFQVGGNAAAAAATSTPSPQSAFLPFASGAATAMRSISPFTAAASAHAAAPSVANSRKLELLRLLTASNQA